MFRTLVLVALSFVGCSMIKPNKIIMKEVTSNSYSNVNNIGVEIITSGTDLKKFWDIATPGANGAGIPIIDFKEENIVVIHAGKKSSGGYRIELNDYVVNKNSVHLNVTIVRPSGPATMAITTPFKMYSVPKNITNVTADFNK